MLATPFLALACAAQAPAAFPDWIDRAPLPTPRQELAVVLARGEVFTIGGISLTQFGTTTVEAYDPDVDRWRAVADLPAPIHHPGAAAVGDRLFVLGGESFGGFSAVADVWEYDFVLDQWVARAPMLDPHGAAAVAVWDDQIYVMAGVDDHHGATTKVERYDPVTDTWTALPDCAIAREHCGAAAFDGKIYLMSGRNGGLIAQTEIFDVATRTWSFGAPIPTARGGIAVVGLNGYVAVLGGEGNPARPDGLFAEVEVYDPVADVWHTFLPMGNPRHGIGAVATIHAPSGLGVVFVPGGADVQGFGPVGTADALVFRP